MSADLAFWNEVFETVRQEGLRVTAPDQDWLTPYLPLLRGQLVHHVLEIGCGAGFDTECLATEGFDVTATDFSMNALSIVRERLPAVKLLLHNTRDPFPFSSGAFDLVLASLSLHYFDEQTTREIVEEIQRLLRPKGLLLFRVNSTSDHSFGTGQGDLLEQHFFVQDGIRRRYFTEDSCRGLFPSSDWEELVLEEKVVERYRKSKALYEGLMQKKA